MKSLYLNPYIADTHFMPNTLLINLSQRFLTKIKLKLLNPIFFLFSYIEILE